MKELQTPKKDYQHANRRSKSIPEHIKKSHSQKISKKNLDSVFSSVSEDVALESPKDLIDFSSISETLEDHTLGESAESYLTSVNPVISPSSETISLSDLTPLASPITTDKDEAGDIVSVGENCVDVVAVEAEMVVNRLKQARIQVLNSTNADLHSRKLLDALIEVVIEEFNALPEEKDRFAELFATKTLVVILSFLLWILAVSVVFLFSSGLPSYSSEPPPT